MAGWLAAHFGSRKDRVEARRAGEAPVATGLRQMPQGRWTGDPALGLNAPESHDFAWLDHLAAIGDEAAGRLAHRRLTDWATQFGRGDGPGWTAEAAAWRLLRWLDHAGFADPRQTVPDTLAILSRHVAFLHRRWESAPEGMPRIAALAASITGTLALKGLPNRIGIEVEALATLADFDTRNPEELLDLLVLLLTADAALRTAGQDAHFPAIGRIVAELRCLCHEGGRLARFHGGGAGIPGRLDAALAEARSRHPAPHQALGFHRLHAGRSSVIMDTAPPPATALAHASSLAFELTSGRRPIVVNCGPGQDLPDWARASRATASHSTLSLEGHSSSRLGPAEMFTEIANVRGVHRQTLPEGTHLQASHDGWSASHGLTHTRDLLLSPDGRRLVGQDMLAAHSMAERRRFFRLNAPRFQIHFHLHPDVEAVHHPGADSAALHLRSGEVWTLSFEGPAHLELRPSSHLERGLAAPRPSHQVILAGIAAETSTQIGWTLAKTQDTPLAIRDLARDEDPASPDDLEPT
ncbi:heparinase II/III family protein [Cereibacter sp. SYSU M97828]|nr:heparinase II/III family protein [Cereibacter flavus]